MGRVVLPENSNERRKSHIKLNGNYERFANLVEQVQQAHTASMQRLKHHKKSMRSNSISIKTGGSTIFTNECDSKEVETPIYKTLDLQLSPAAQMGQENNQPSFEEKEEDVSETQLLAPSHPYHDSSGKRHYSVCAYNAWYNE